MSPYGQEVKIERAEIELYKKIQIAALEMFSRKPLGYIEHLHSLKQGWGLGRLRTAS